jgi:uncharacterized membrane protein YfcA
MSVTLAVIALFIGISLGLVGAGGAIIAVPAFEYVSGIDSNLAEGYALFVVAISSSIGVAMQLRSRLIDWKVVLWFGMFTSVSMVITRGFLDNLVSSQLQEILFGVILVLAAVGMLRKRKQSEAQASPNPRILSIYGILIGIISGLLGVGGGFLMTPTLVIGAGLDMKHAVASSLVLICANAALGVSVDLMQGVAYDWNILLVFTGLTTAGIVTGTILSRRINSSYLRDSYGWLVLTVGLIVLGIEAFSLYSSYGTQS